MSKKKGYEVIAKGILWKCFMQTKASYVRAHGKDSEAITYPYDKEVFFNSSRFNPKVVRHEILHVFVASSGINSANLTGDQMEEVCAEIYEEHGPEMDLLVDKILDFFMR